MQKHFIRHKLTVGDITHLSDEASEHIITEGKLHEGDLVQVDTLDMSYIAVITYIDKASVEVEVKKEIEHTEEISKDIRPKLTIIQAVPQDNQRFNYFLEKCTELGVDQIIPISSQYTKLSPKVLRKQHSKWEGVIKDATEQSRNSTPPHIHPLSNLQSLNLNTLGTSRREAEPARIVLSTENTDTQPINQTIKPGQDLLVAIGPESGWSSQEINIFRENHFQFVTLGENILRTETAGLVVTSIYHFINNTY